MGLAEKGYEAGVDYDLEDVDLCTLINFDDSVVVSILTLYTVTAANFDPEYLKINPYGTVPSLTSPSLSKPLSDSVDILRYLDNAREGSLTLGEPTAQRRMQEIIDLVHSDEVGTNLILLQARDQGEMEKKKASMWATFLNARQAKLDKYRADFPGHSFYEPKATENRAVWSLYNTEVVGDSHQSFFQLTEDMYRKFAAGVDKLDSLLVLPYAASNQVSEADLHAIPWLSHAMWGAGTPPHQVQNFEVLEALIQKSVPDFKVGPRVKEWWSNIVQRDSFKAVFPELH